MKLSAGILLFRRTNGGIHVLLGHMGGPFWARRDATGWTIPKGEVEGDDDALATARREFAEEMGHPLPDDDGDLIDLGEFVQSSRKTVRVWALEGDLDASTCVSNTFEMEWPPKSGQVQSFPELDRAEWYSLDVARDKLIKGQVPVLDALVGRLSAGG